MTVLDPDALPGIDIGNEHTFVWMVAKGGYYEVPKQFKNWHAPNEEVSGPKIDHVDLIGIVERHYKPCDTNMPHHLGAVEGHEHTKAKCCPANCPGREWCGGAVYFTKMKDKPNAPTWQVESLDPLTISPSILCSECGSHGFIRNGRWENA